MEEETEQDQTCTRDSRWGCGTEAGIGSLVGATARDSGQSEAPGERGGSPATVLRPSHSTTYLGRDARPLQCAAAHPPPAEAERTEPGRQSLRTPGRDPRTLKGAAAGCWAVGIGSELNPRARSTLTAGRGPGSREGGHCGGIACGGTGSHERHCGVPRGGWGHPWGLSPRCWQLKNREGPGRKLAFKCLTH